MWLTALIPFALQGAAIFFDEVVFHIRRGLPKWERVGHPLDTLSVLVCLAFVIWVPFSKQAMGGYVLLAVGSSIFVTKDEFVHNACCPAAEQWLHALLFTLHPITLACAGCIWPVVQGVEVAPWLAEWLNCPVGLRRFLYVQFSAMGLFMVYQIVFWNFVWDDSPRV